MLTRLAVSTFLVSIMMSCIALGQDFPKKPIRIVTSEAGGNNDFLSRLIAQGITGDLGQPIIVENRPGVVVSGQLVSRAVPDGYTLLLSGSVLWIGPLLQAMAYDPVKDFSAITTVGTLPLFLVINPSLPVKSVKDLIGLARTKPGELNYASVQTGTAVHLAAELLKSMANVNITRIPYKGTAGAVTAIFGGEVQMMFATAPTVMPHVKAGKLRVLAVTSAQPSTQVPDLPTMASSGLPGYEAVTVIGIVAPAKTPIAVVHRLNQAIVRVVSRPDVKEKLLSSGMEAEGTSPEVFDKIIKSEIARMGKVIKDASIRAD